MDHCGMLRLFVGVLLMVATTCYRPPTGNAQDCEPLKPQQTEKSVNENDVKASANALFKQLGSGDFQAKSLHTQEDLQSKYPNADKLECVVDSPGRLS
jgi:hypothetical protein